MVRRRAHQAVANQYPFIGNTVSRQMRSIMDLTIMRKSSQDFLGLLVSRFSFSKDPGNAYVTYAVAFKVFILVTYAVVFEVFISVTYAVVFEVFIFVTYAVAFEVFIFVTYAVAFEVFIFVTYAVAFKVFIFVTYAVVFEVFIFVTYAVAFEVFILVTYAIAFEVFIFVRYAVAFEVFIFVTYAVAFDVFILVTYAVAFEVFILVTYAVAFEVFIFVTYAVAFEVFILVTFEGFIFVTVDVFIGVTFNCRFLRGGCELSNRLSSFFDIFLIALIAEFIFAFNSLDLFKCRFSLALNSSDFHHSSDLVWLFELFKCVEFDVSIEAFILVTVILFRGMTFNSNIWFSRRRCRPFDISLYRLIALIADSIAASNSLDSFKCCLNLVYSDSIFCSMIPVTLHSSDLNHPSELVWLIVIFKCVEFDVSFELFKCVTYAVSFEVVGFSRRRCRTSNISL